MRWSSRSSSCSHLARYRHEPVGSLPYGVQKRVELGRVLAMEPELLMLDEPMAGMSVDEKRDMVGFIFDIRAALGTTVLLIEHDMGVVMAIAERVMVLDNGRRIALGSPAEVQQRRRGHRRVPGVVMSELMRRARAPASARWRHRAGALCDTIVGAVWTEPLGPSWR